MMLTPLTRRVSFALSLVLLFTATASAQPTAPDEAKRHFLNGVHLFEDRNFAGALVEFEASFQQNPTAAALQNIAVCQKGLFRYADAITTLQRMLKEFAAQLSAEDKRAAEDAVRDMTALLGTLVLRVSPKAAKITINESPISAETASKPIRLPAGEYRIAAEAPGFARMETTVTLVSGSTEKVVPLTLLQQTGTLSIHAGDSQAAIAVDNVPVGYDDWKGTVPAGPHEVYVYTSTLRHRVTVMVLPEQTTEFDVKLSPKDAMAAAVPSAELPAYVPPPAQRGLYGTAGIRFDRLSVIQPKDFVGDKGFGGMFLSLAGGYRFSTSWAAELVLSQGVHNMDACVDKVNSSECTTTLSTTRVGANVRLMTLGRRYRFFATTGLGVAAHRLSLVASNGSKTKENGAGGLFTLGGGFELSGGHWLIDAIIDVTTESANHLDSIGSALNSAGLELRIGYGQW